MDRQRIGYVVDAEHQVHGAGRDGAPRHAVVLGLLGVLHDHQAATCLDGGKPDRAVLPRPGQHDAHRPLAVARGQGREQEVERQALAAGRIRLRQMQQAVHDRQVEAGRNDIHVVALEQRSVGGLHDRHGGLVRQQFHQQAVMGRVEVLHEDEGHAVAVGQPADQPGARLEPACGGADADDREQGGR